MEWIKTREQRPKTNQRCLITVDDILFTYVVEAALYFDNKFYLYCGSHYIEAEGVDYWMPAPKIPPPINMYRIERKYNG